MNWACSFVNGGSLEITPLVPLILFYLAPRPVTPPKPRTWLVGDEAWQSVKREVERIK